MSSFMVTCFFYDFSDCKLSFFYDIIVLDVN